jgi:hypothetical protein
MRPEWQPLVVNETGPDQAASISERVVTSVAVATDRPATKLPPLYDRVETDGIEALYGRPSERCPTVSFEYAGVTVSIDPEGNISVYEPNPDESVAD